MASSPAIASPSSDVLCPIEIERVAPDRWRAVAALPNGEVLGIDDEGDPLRAAEQRLPSLPAQPDVVVLVGAGLGYGLEAARLRWPEARLIVFEPYAALADSLRARLPRLLDDRVTILIGPSYAGADSLWRTFDRLPAAEPAVIVHPAMERAAPGATAAARGLLQRALSAGAMNAQARADNAGRYLLNTLRNLPLVARGADASRLRGKFAGVPTIIAAAGPSLDRSLDALRDVAGKALLIAVDTAWRPLANAGIDPSIVVAVDPTELNGRHLVGVPFRRAPLLLAEASVEPRALRASGARPGTLRIADHHPWPWLRSNGIAPPQTRVWGSVLTAAFDLAVELGGDPIAFVGADLAFTGGRPYCRGTTFEEEWAGWVGRGVSLSQVWSNTLASRRVLEAAGVDGRPALTSPHLVEFRDWIAAQANQLTGRRVVNATGAGILTGGRIEQSDLAAIFAGRGERFDPSEQIVDAGSAGAESAVAGALDALLSDDWATSLPAVVSVWMTFAGGKVGAGEIRQALEDARRELGEGNDTARVMFEGSARRHRMPAADRVSRLRALLDEGVGADADPGAGADTGDAREALERILARPGTLVDDDPSEHAPRPASPVSLRFKWRGEIEDEIALFEERLIAAAAKRQPAVDGAFWSGAIDPVDDDGHRAIEPATIDPDTVARLALLAQWLAVGDAPQVEPRVRRVIAAAAAAIDRPVLIGGDGWTVSGLAPEPRTLPLRADAFMRAATGSIVAGPLAASGDPRWAFLDSPDYVEPIVLTDRGLPRSWSCATIDADTAIVTPGHAVNSIRLTTDGGLDVLPAWPLPLSGEVPWGSAGGSLAWSRQPAAIMLRPEPRAESIVFEMPFTPMRPAIATDGSTCWTAVEGGLWHWRPGEPAVKLNDVPASFPVRMSFDADGTPALVAGPITRDAGGRMLRRRHEFEWVCGRDGTSLRREPTGRDGIMSSASTSGAWTASAHPFADVVNLHGPGRQLVLGCYAPIEVAWLGPSLLVVVADGSVLLFPDLAARLGA